MQQGQQIDHKTLAADDDFVLPINKLLSAEGRALLTQLLMKDDVSAVRARSERGNYRIELVGHSRFQRLRSTVLISAFFAAVEKTASDSAYSRLLAPFAREREDMVITDVGDSLRIYHFVA